ncbi:MAG: hypothetical protein WBQ75_00350 [Acetobacteraceae bacterium]
MRTKAPIRTPPAGQFLHPIERQARHVHQQVRQRHAQAHVIDQVGAAAEEGRAGTAHHGGDGARRVGRALIGERVHRAASLIAATMFT